jgi:ATP-binding cassette, subfamily B, bacterial PglK
MLKKLWIHLDKAYQKRFLVLLMLMFAASVAEVISIGSVLPFLSLLISPDQVYNHEWSQPLIQFLSVKTPEQLLLPFTIIFVAMVVLAGVIRISLVYFMTKLSYEAGSSLSVDIYQRTLYQEYKVHISRNSSEVVNGVVTKTNLVINNVLIPLLTLISAVIFIVFALSILLIINSTTTLIVIFIFGALYWGMVRITKKKLQANSACIATQSTLMVKSLQEGLGSIRDVLIDGSQKFYLKIYRDADFSFRQALGSNLFIGTSPKFIMESLGIIMIALIAYNLGQEGLMDTIPVLGAIALGAQKLLPILQQAYHSYSNLKGAKASFDDVIKLLDQPLTNSINQKSLDLIAFEKEININNLSFRYNDNEPWVLKDINLTILKGARIGFIGKTGSGKSTLLDLVMGLLSPVKGEIAIDNKIINKNNQRQWQMKIAHVPQSIFLSDNSIMQNIAFGIEPDKIDYDLVYKAAEQAQISQLINGWKNGYETIVGERGVKISGGQRQRIGIARALYKKASILIFDEATSALDNETESEIMQSIKNLDRNLTILIIAHRLSTLDDCDQIVEVDDGQIRISSFK